MAWYAKFDGVDGATGNRDAPSVHDIAVSKFHESESNVERVVKVLDAGTFSDTLYYRLNTVCVNMGM